MTPQELERHILDALAEIAPEVNFESLDRNKSFRDQFELDSIDYLRFVLALEKRIGATVPEVDYPKLSSVSGCMAYLESKLG
jgi:acyl carrier protein